MRRIILGVVTLMITCAIGLAISYGVHYVPKRLPAPATVEPAPLVVSQTTDPFPISTPPNPSPPYSRPASLILDYDLERYARYGALYILSPAPEGFEDFNCIAMSLGAGGHVDYPGYITVYTGTEENGDMADANFALVTEQRFYFTTKPSNEHGFEYRFEGDFLVKDFAAVEGKNKAAVRGTLTKFKNGRKLAEQTLTFRMEYLQGC